MKVWIDIDTPPQVQYLLPFRAAFEDAGAETVVTARDYGATVALLEQAGAEAHVCGRRVGRGRWRKVAGAVTRAQKLQRHLTRVGRPDVLLAACRASALAARRLRIPSFIVGDYEHANLSAYRFTGSTILHPEVMDPQVLIDRGLRPERTVAFQGIKEDLTFAGVDVDAVAPHDLGPVPGDAVRVLFRPPSETSHYYDEASSAMAMATLSHLARACALVVYSPREPGQVAYLDGLPWAHAPIVLEEPAPFVALLKSVDAVVCAGGTMLREAAYLGLPAYSILRSEVGAVDRWLERIGRAALLAGPHELDRIELRRREGGLQRLDSNLHLLDQLVELIATRVEARQRRPSVAV
jgi:uncharacterized protein